MKDERLHPGYRPSFDIDRQLGELGEARARLVRGSALEVKVDQKAFHTGNLYIEFECKGKPSGLDITEADYWWFCLGGDGSMVGAVMLVLSTADLRDLVKGCRIAGETDGSHPTRGYLLPLSKVFRRPVVEVHQPEDVKQLMNGGARHKSIVITNHKFRDADPSLRRWLEERGI